jgi:hypothetical protein
MLYNSYFQNIKQIYCKLYILQNFLNIIIIPDNF